MPRLTPSDLHRDSLLEAVAIRYMQDPANFVASRVFGVVPVSKESDYFRTYDLGDLLRMRAQKRADGTEAAIQSIGKSDTRYACEEHALKDFVTPREQNADDLGTIREDKTEALTGGLLIDQEIDWGTKYFTTGVWGVDWTGVASASPTYASPTYQYRQFDHSGCDPKHELLRIKKEMHSKTGFMPNVFVCTLDVFNALLVNASLVARVSGGANRNNPADLDAGVLAGILGFEEILVSKAVRNEAAEGATDDIDLLFTNRAMVAYRQKTPSKVKPSAGYTFICNKFEGYSQPGQVVVDTYERPELSHREDIEVKMIYDQKVCAANLGAYLGSPLGNP